MNKLYIEEYEIYSNRTATNATVDYVLRHKLAKTLPQAFEVWRSTAEINAGNNNTYDEISSDERLSGKASEIKKKALEDFLKNYIDLEKERITEGFQEMTSNRKIEARGFIRNNYVLKRKEMGPELFNMAAQSISEEFDDFNYKTSEEFLADSDTILEELNRRMIIMNRAKEIEASYDQESFKLVD
tara:strand:- start:48 stop:605 length:558 start_codon:yes stop_codon:yes gene_type:complete